MKYSEACTSYELFRGRGFGVCLVRRSNEFFCEWLPGCPVILRAGGDGWEEVRGKSREFPELGQMPIRLQSRHSFVREFNARREVLGS